MLPAMLAIGGIGLVAGLGLAIASKAFYVYVDPTISAVDDALPGANCGGCGFAGCSSAAEAIAAGDAPPSICVAGGAATDLKVAEIMGMEIKETEAEIALLGCAYGTDTADLKYQYDGLIDCRAANLLNGGSKECPIGCLGLGSCVKSCQFGAMKMGEDNLPIVISELCVGCGACERVCPKNIIKLSSNSMRVTKEFTTEDCTAPCQRACPAGIDIPGYIQQIADKNYPEAVRIIKENNPFPSVCGRICIHPCEYDCRRTLVDEPVAINHLKRFATDYEMRSGERVQISRAPVSGKKVAVVGGGAQGLTAAYYLNRLGHDSAVYDAASKLGGILHLGLPENRLPRDVLDYEINGILETGVVANTSQMLGRDFTIESLLKEGYFAVLIATGGWDTKLAEKDNESQSSPLPGIQLLLDFILKRRAGNTPNVGNSVVIQDGGKAALETAKALKTQGVQSISIAYRAAQENAPITEEEIKKAEREGIQIFFRSAVTKIIGEGSQLTKLLVTRYDNQSQKSKEEQVNVDTLITGGGRLPELIFVANKKSSDTISWEAFTVYTSPQAEQDSGIFRPGEVISDYNAVIEAIGSGRRAASSVQHFMNNNPVEAPSNMVRKTTPVLNLDEVEPVLEIPRQPMPNLPIGDQLNDPSKEIALGYEEHQANQEANRCLQCGLICYRQEGKTNISID
jgi:formate dehydrogenase (NADP+) beta subunit